MKLFKGTKTDKLASEIEDILGTKCGNLSIEKFSDGEILPRFDESIRGEDLYFIQTTNNSDSIMETLLVSDAAKRAGCKSFTLISPYMGYSRQDKVDHTRSSIGSKLLADILTTSGVSRLITIDLHASSIQACYNFPVIHLNGNKIFIDYIRSLNIPDMLLLSPDQGAIKRVSDFAKHFPDAGFALINKKRVKPNEIHSMELLGDVTDKNVIIIDDMADTANTLKKAAQLVIDNGAKSVRAIATHGVLSGNAYLNIESSVLTELIVSDTISTEKSPKIRVISCASMISKAIKSLETNTSIHSLNV